VGGDPRAARAVPRAWRDVPVHHIGRAEVADPEALRATVDLLRRERLERRAVVVVLDPALPWARLTAPARERRPLWTLGPGHRLLGDELAFLLADLVDARSGEAVWWPAIRARRLGCVPPTRRHGDGPDVLLPDGRRARPRT